MHQPPADASQCATPPNRRLPITINDAPVPRATSTTASRGSTVWSTTSLVLGRTELPSTAQRTSANALSPLRTRVCPLRLGHVPGLGRRVRRSEEDTSELQSL